MVARGSKTQVYSKLECNLLSLLLNVLDKNGSEDSKTYVTGTDVLPQSKNAKKKG